MRIDQRVVVFFLIVAFGFLIRGDGESRAAAPQREPIPTGRYQISAWAVPPTGASTFSQTGCFLVDTGTGELWEYRRDGEKREWVRVTGGPTR